MSKQDTAYQQDGTRPKNAGRRQTLWRLFGFLKPKRFQYFSGMLGFAVISTAERMFIAYLVKLFVDTITTRSMPLLLHTLVLWALFYSAFFLVLPIPLYLWRTAIYRGVANIREIVFRHLQRLPLGYHELHHSGEVMSVLTNDIAAAEGAYQNDLLNLVQNSLMGVSATVFMLLLDWKLALLIIASGMVSLIINTLFAKPLRRVGENVQAKLGTMSERLSDLLAGFQVVRTFNLSDWILDRFNRANGEVLDSSLKRVQLESSQASANQFGALAFFFTFFVGAYWTMTGQTTLGLLIANIQLNNQIGGFFYSLGGIISRIQASLAATDRILTILDTPLEPERYNAEMEVALPAAPSSENALLEFSNVRFDYGDSKQILKGISFEIMPDQVAAFVGPSGGGKTTIFRLLLGCYPLRSGTINVSGRSINDYELVRLRDLFAYVPQDAYLYSGSIMDNIRYGKPGATDEEVYSAAKAAYAHDFILALPQGYSSLVGERGARLSGGQRQRIAIARALLKNAPILLLDEATSALDSESEQLVQQALAVLMKGRTVLVIAHRLSTIESADTIYVIDDGRIVEQGKQDDLLKLNGLYRHLHDIQFRQEEATSASVPGFQSLTLAG